LLLPIFIGYHFSNSHLYAGFVFVVFFRFSYVIFMTAFHSDPAGIIFGWLFLLLLFVLYALPSVIAFARDHNFSKEIAVLNLLFGWSVIGWVVALVWALDHPDGRPSSM
jgi:hypothetical protein